MKKKFIFNTKELKNLEAYKEKINKEINIYYVSAANNPKNNTLIFISDMDNDTLKKVNLIRESIILVNFDVNDELINNNLVLKVENPRREYAKILSYILNLEIKENQKFEINEQGYVIGKNVEIGKETMIEPFVIIGDNCKIGEKCIIRSGVKIRENTVIGNECSIKENSVIGDEGFGIERDENGKTYRIPHLGGVVLGNNVEVGALVAIAQGTIEPTIIEDYVKIDDCVFIAHNCKIEKGTYIIANAEISGGVHIGQCSWIGPSTAIIDNVNIGKNVTTGIGAVIIKNISDNEVVAGNPADTTQNLKKLKAIREELLKNK